MSQQNFNISEFKQFKTSSGLDGDVTGLYAGKVVRIFRNNFNLYKEILSLSKEIHKLIKSKPFYEDENYFIIEHEKLENITYSNEWTKKQKVDAAKTIIEVQSSLVKKDFYLKDPHAFNITFKYYQPIYIDFGSIKKGKINPAWWFIKCFCGWTENDYWDDVLKISLIQKLWISLVISISSKPYSYLSKKILTFESGIIERKLHLLLNRKGIVGRLIRKIVNSFPNIFKGFSNWTDYNQKSPEINFADARNKNILNLLNQYNPEKVLDIGANKGAFSLLSLSSGAKEAIAIDLDNYSLDFLFNQIKTHKNCITIAKLNVMNYPDNPGHYQTYLPAHERLFSDFVICLAVVHHVCYFGSSSFDEFSERLSRFAKKILVVEFVPSDDIHLTGNVYKGKDRSWYTTENFITVMKKYFPGLHEIYDSTPSPRLLIKFTR